jgi:DNA-binding response OmpR family regulator
MRLLLITGRSVANALLPRLKEDGVFVEVADSSEEGDARLRASAYDAVVLDQLHVEECGRAQLLRWRREGVKAHVLVLLPADSGPAERTACFDGGADVCLEHPLNPEELRAHLGALRRRVQRQTVPVRRVHDLVINPNLRSVTRAGRDIHLTPREFDLLSLLASQPGKILSRSAILQHLYSPDGNGNGHHENVSNVVEVYVRYLRKKIDEGFDTPPLILTRRGQGYLFRAEAE